MKRNQNHMPERSIWKRTENIDIRTDQFGYTRNMSSDDPNKYINGAGWQIRYSTQLSSFLPKNIAGVSYNFPFRYYGSNPKHWNNIEMI